MKKTCQYCHKRTISSEKTAVCPKCKRITLNELKIGSVPLVPTEGLLLFYFSQLCCVMLMLSVGFFTFAVNERIGIRLVLFMLSVMLWIVAHDGWMAVRTKIDNTKNHIARGREAVFWGIIKIALGFAPFIFLYAYLKGFVFNQ